MKAKVQGVSEKNVDCQTGNQEYFEKLENFESFKNFCFHVYAQKSLFIAENCNVFFGTSSASSPSPVSLDVIELVPS